MRAALERRSGGSRQGTGMRQKQLWLRGSVWLWRVTLPGHASPPTPRQATGFFSCKIRRDTVPSRGLCVWAPGGIYCARTEIG